MKPNPLSGTNGQLMVMAAHRYCLGRRSYIVGACVEWLRLWWNEFEANTQSVIVRDTVEALQDGFAGDKCHAEEWTRFAQQAYNNLTEEGQQWVRQAVEYRKKNWPL